MLAAADVNAPWNGHDTRVLIVAVLGIALIVLLIVAVKLHAFLALTIGCAVRRTGVRDRGRRGDEVVRDRRRRRSRATSAC